MFADDDLGLRLSCFGEFETEILTHLRKSFGSDLVKTHFIDVGANIEITQSVCITFIIATRLTRPQSLSVAPGQHATDQK